MRPRLEGKALVCRFFLPMARATSPIYGQEPGRTKRLQHESGRASPKPLFFPEKELS